VLPDHPLDRVVSAPAEEPESVDLNSQLGNLIAQLSVAPLVQTEGGGDAVEHGRSWGLPAALVLADHGVGDPKAGGKRLLIEAGGSAQGAQPDAQRGLAALDGCRRPCVL
jgi:hypothetical protein